MPHKFTLIKHFHSERHIKNYSLNISKINEKEKGNGQKTDKDVKRVEMKLAAFIAEHNLPFDVMNRLVPLRKYIFQDSNIATIIASERAKATQIIKKAIGNNCTYY